MRISLTRILSILIAFEDDGERFGHTEDSFSASWALEPNRGHGRRCRWKSGRQQKVQVSLKLDKRKPIRCSWLWWLFWLWFVSCLRRLMFPSKISPSLNMPDLHPKVTYCFSKGSPVSSQLCLCIYSLWLWFVLANDLCFTCGCSGYDCFYLRCSMECHFLDWRALSRSRKSFYVGQMGQTVWKPSSAAGSLANTRRHQGKVTAQVRVFRHTTLYITL